MFSIRSVMTVGLLTLMSRFVGFARDMLIAGMIGTGPVADAWFVAMRLPNLFRRLFAEGAFNAAFVPMFARRLEEHGTKSAIAFAERVLSTLLLFLLVLTVLAEMAMPLLITIFAPGFREDPAKFNLTILFTSVTFPYLLFMCLCALQSGILNSLQRFAHAASAPIILNVVLVGLLVALKFSPDSVTPEATGHALVWGVALSGLLQFLWLTWALKGARVALRLPRPGFGPEIRRLVKLMGPGLVSGGITQINIMIATILASQIAGAVSYLSYADRIYQLPLALIGTAIGIVLLPSLARSLRAGEDAAAMATFNRCLEFGLLLSLPATIGITVTAEPVIATLYQRGAFDMNAAHNTALALAALGAGLPAYVLNKSLSPGFFAREDTMTPFKFALVSVGCDIVLSVALFYVMGFVGIALATAIAAWINTGLLFLALRRRKHLTIDARLKRALPRLLLCTALTAATLHIGAAFLRPWLAAGEPLRIIALILLVLGAVFVYFAAVALTRAYPLRSALTALRRR